MGTYDLILTAFNISSQVNKLLRVLRLSFASAQWMAHIPSYRVIKKLITTDKMLNVGVSYRPKVPSRFLFRNWTFFYISNIAHYIVKTLIKSSEKHGQAQSNDYCLHIIYIYKKP